MNVGKPLKILQFNTFYRPFLEDFYRKNPGLENLSHAEQQKHLYQSGFSVVHNFIPGLWQLGYEALFVVANNWHSQAKWMSENGFACNNGTMWPYEILAQQINCFRPDVVLAFDAFMFDGDFFKQLLWHPLLVIGWTGEYVPDNINWDGYDLILSNFSFPRKKAVELGAAKSEQFYPGFVEWLADGSVHDEPAFDVVFCGQWSGLHEKRNTFLLDIVRKNSSNSNNNNNNFSLRYHLLGNYEQMPAEVRRVIKPPVFGVEMHQVLRRSKIALNFDYLPEAGNMRQFEVTGTGVFLLTENLPGLDSYFKPGVEVETFSSIDEVMEKIDYYLKHETERELIAAAGQRRCLRDHSMTVQVRKLDEIIRKNLSEKSGVNLCGLNANESLINVSRVVSVSRKVGFDRGTPIERGNDSDGFELVETQDDLSNIYRLAKEKRFGKWKVDFSGLTIYCHDLLSFYMAAKDIFLQRIYEFKCNKVAPRVVDGGGHIGLFTLMVKKLYPDARITVFEPDPKSLWLLRKNITENKFEGVEIFEAGLFNCEGKVAFDSDHSDGSSIFGETGSSSINVKSLKPFLEGGVDFLKLNIEGAELEVLKDCQDLLSEVKEIVIEYHGFPEVGQRLHEILAILDRSGFRYLIHDFDKVTNPATKPPFSLSEKSKYFLLIYALKLFPAKEVKDQRAGKKIGFEPVSRKFGFDRGTPIDRFYMDKFLSGNASLISGEVLEVAGKDYSLRYGGNIQNISVLSVAPGAGIDLVGNLETGENIPFEKFDCIILTQTMQMIFDVHSALRHSYMALKPGGSILLTASGISQISRYDMDRWGEYWRFTDKSMGRLIAELLPMPKFEIKTYGNVGVAKAFLDGLASEELPADSLAFNDPDYQLLVAARITKPTTNSLKREKKNEKACMVLIYHRVADDPVDRNLLTVSPDNFAEHLQVLRDEFRPVSLSQFLGEAEKGNLKPGTVSLTFDDGYLDNLHNALPLLEKYGVHATVFVTSGMVGSQKEFWWDAMERIFLADPQRKLPERIVFMDSQGEEQGWRTVSKVERLRAHDEICSMLRSNSVAEINEFIEKIYLWAGGSSLPRKSHLVLNEQKLKELSESSMIEIGAHTVNHSRLTALSFSEQKFEIEASKNELERIIDKSVKLFSYPYGCSSDFSSETKRIVKICGFEYGIANIQSDFILPFDKFAIPRRLVRNWEGRLFKKWITGSGAERGRLDSLTCQQKGVELVR